MLYRAARAIVRDDTAAEEALREAWLRAYSARDALDAGAGRRAWLVRTVVEEARARARRGPEKTQARPPTCRAPGADGGGA